MERNWNGNPVMFPACAGHGPRTRGRIGKTGDVFVPRLLFVFPFKEFFDGHPPFRNGLDRPDEERLNAVLNFFKRLPL